MSMPLSRLLHSVVRVSSARTATVGRNVSAVAAFHRMDSGQKLKVVWQDGQEATYHAKWLRHNCKCPKCWEPTSGQKVLSTSELQSHNMSLHSATIQPDSAQLDLKWSTAAGGTDHQGCVELDWLKSNAYGSSVLEQIKEDSKPHAVASSLPVVEYSEGEEGKWLWSWMYQLNEYGMCLLRRVPVKNGQVKEIAKIVGPVFNTHYGDMFNVISQEKAVNIANTERELPLHVDLVYLESPPGLQLLHCLRNDSQVVGGKSVLLDGWAVVEELKNEFPQHFDTLTKIPATFDKIQKDRSIRHRRPHIVVDRDGTVVQINWSPQNHGPLAVKEEEIEPYYQAYNILADMLENSKLKVTHLLRPGEVLTFNNRRVLHSRTEYHSNGGLRQLQGAYVGSDHFKSKVKTLAEKYTSGKYTVKSVLNGCSY